MRSALLDTTYSIASGTSYIIENPIINESWLTILLCYNDLYLLSKGSKCGLYDSIINIHDYPLDAIIYDYKITDKEVTDIQEVTLRLISYCVDNNICYCTGLPSVDREKYITEHGKEFPGAINHLKKSFLSFDIASTVITYALPSIKGNINKGLVNEIYEYKNSDIYKELLVGIDDLTIRYDGSYYITQETGLEIKDQLSLSQNKLLEVIKVDFKKTIKFDFSSIAEDVIGAVAGILTPIFPLGTIKSIYEYIKKTTALKDDKRLLFALSIMYLQSVLSKYFVKSEISPQCPICKITKVEVDQISEMLIHDYVFSNTKNLCMNHLVSYLHIRKFMHLTGRELLKALKDFEHL